LSKHLPKLSGAISQRAKINFMCKSGRSAAKMLHALQAAYGYNARKQQLFVTDTTASRVGKNCWKMNLAVFNFFEQ
jgi:hypothetical protein